MGACHPKRWDSTDDEIHQPEVDEWGRRSSEGTGWFYKCTPGDQVQEDDEIYDAGIDLEEPPPCAGMTCENLRCHCRVDGEAWMQDYVTKRILRTSPTCRVVHCFDKSRGEEVVLKSFNKSAMLRQNRSFSRRVQDPMKKALLEIKIMQTIAHQSIVSYYKTINVDNMLHIAMEFMEGGATMLFNEEKQEYDALMIVCGGLTCENLFCHCRGTAPTECTALPVHVAHAYFRDALMALECIHGMHVAHRDIKPDNLLVSEPFRIGCSAPPRCKISDFGVSCFISQESDMLQDTQGTAQFFSPESLSGESYSSTKTDIWALGVSLFCFLFKKLPFAGNSIQALHHAICHDLLILPPDLDPNLQDLLEQLFCKDAQKRPGIEGLKLHPWVKSAPMDLEQPPPLSPINTQQQDYCSSPTGYSPIAAPAQEQISLCGDDV